MNDSTAIVGLERIDDDHVLVHLVIDEKPAHSLAVIGSSDGIRFVNFHPDFLVGARMLVRPLIERVLQVAETGFDPEINQDLGVRRAISAVREYMQDPITYLHDVDGEIFAALVSLELLGQIDGGEDLPHGHIDPT